MTTFNFIIIIDYDNYLNLFINEVYIKVCIKHSFVYNMNQIFAFFLLLLFLFSA